MSTTTYREAHRSDIPGMACIRAVQWETEDYWKKRISAYIDGELHPQKALAPRVVYVAVEGKAVIGLIAGHLTRRYDCDGELEWIDVIQERRRSGVASELLRRLAEWFAGKKASRICVDVDPANQRARGFYVRHGAVDLNKHWLVWEDIGVVLDLKRL